MAQDKEKQISRLKSQYINEQSNTLNHKYPEIRKYMRKLDCNVELLRKEEIRYRILRLKEFIKGVKLLVRYNIRNYFS